MGFVRRRVSGNYFGGSSLIVPGQGVYSIKKYNNFIGKTGVPKDNYDDIPKPTPTPTPSNTPIPSNTPTPTPTPTPTGTEVILIDPILTHLDEYIVVGNHEYLMFVDPEPEQCKCFNFIYDFSGREDICTAEYVDCDGVNKRINIVVGDNYICTNDQKSFVLSYGCNGSIVEVTDSGVCSERCGSKPCKKYEISSTSGCDIGYIDCSGNPIRLTLTPFEVIQVCSTSTIDYVCKGVSISDLGVCL